MKRLIILVSLILGSSAFAGGMLEIPIQLLPIDNQGRIEFIKSALYKTGLLNDETVRYQSLQSVIVGGDEEGSDFKGALMIYGVKLESSKNGFQQFHCSQRLSVGNFDQQYTRPIECENLK